MEAVGNGAAAARLNPVETLQEEAICAICLDYFVEPVSIGCGHNFCRVCIARLWGEAELDESGGAAALEEEEEEEEEEDGGGEEEEDDMWSEEEEDGELWEDPVEEELWDGGVRGELYFGDDDYDEDVMEEDVEEEEEEEDEAQSPPPPVLPARPRRLQTFTCPQCRKTFFQRNFRPNLQLANMVQIIRQLHPHPQRLAPPAGPSASGGPGGSPGVLAATGGRGCPNLCEKHQEPLKLFCEVDEQAICVVCRESRSHKHHSVVPLEEVVQDYKYKLQSHLEPLKKKLDAVLKQKSNEQEKIAELREKMKLEIKEFESDFELLHQFLIGEHVLLLHQLEERYESLLARQSSNVSQLEEQSAALSRLIAEAEDKSKQDGLQLLKVFRPFPFCVARQQHDGHQRHFYQEPEMVLVDVGKKYRNYFLQDVVMRKMEKAFSKVPQ
ncbi:UNVERIFIED_CONTAM: hypothetical protein H355_002478, partial [Colinus virginianus]